MYHYLPKVYSTRVIHFCLYSFLWKKMIMTRNFGMHKIWRLQSKGNTNRKWLVWYCASYWYHFHFMKSVQIRRFFWSVFSCIWTEFTIFSPNTGKYGPQKTLYLDTFHRVFNWNFFSENTFQKRDLVLTSITMTLNCVLQYLGLAQS